MTKQEFLAISLPYGLKMCYKYESRIDIQAILPMHFDCNCQLVNERAMPILHPLSDLTKEIEHEGEKFVPVNRLKFFFGWDYLWNCHKKRETINPYAIPYACFSKLIEWHFDLFGGIDNGEAIDVNTLETNPYR